MEPAYYDDLIRRVVEGRKLIVCADVLVAAASQAKWLRSMGAKRPFLVAGTLGTGEPPSTEDADWILLGTAGGTVMQSIRAFEAALRAPSAELLTALDRYDPDREALVLGTMFMREGTSLGRRAYGTRPVSWERIEDKTVVDELLDEAGIDREPCEVVEAAPDALGRAHRRLDRGTGTAMAGDAREGWWGGGEYLRWARSDDDLAAAAAFFRAHCDRVRVMPFLEGIPCSIHGLVFDEEVIAFRPVEMLTLRTGSDRLHYSGVATYWDPPHADRETMRSAAHRLGRVLRERVSYRGLFTLDGVLGSEGFRPTEINPRAGAGLTPQIAVSQVPLGFLSRMVQEHEPVDLRPAELESLIVERADERRGGGCYCVFGGRLEQTEQHPILLEADRFRPANDGEVPDGSIVLGPSGVGGFVSYRPDPELVAQGPSFAPTAARAFAYTDERFGTGLGPLEPAAAVR